MRAEARTRARTPFAVSIVSTRNVTTRSSKPLNVRADVSYFLPFPRGAKEMGHVCTQARSHWEHSFSLA